MKKKTAGGTYRSHVTVRILEAAAIAAVALLLAIPLEIQISLLNKKADKSKINMR